MYSCTWPTVIAHLRKTTHWRSVYITKVVLLFIPLCLELQQIHPRGCLIRFLVYTRNHTQNIHRWLSICNTCGFEPLLYTSLRNPYIIAFICGSPYALKWLHMLCVRNHWYIVEWQKIEQCSLLRHLHILCHTTF